MSLIISKNRRGQIGQGMTEYIIIVALVAVAGIGAYSYFGQTIRGQMADLGSELSGTAGTNKAAGVASGNTEATAVKKMGTYGDTTTTAPAGTAAAAKPKD